MERKEIATKTSEALFKTYANGLDVVQMNEKTLGNILEALLDTYHEVTFPELASLRASNERLLESKRILGRIISDLPTNRDWLDPDLERQAKYALNPPEAPHAV